MNATKYLFLNAVIKDCINDDFAVINSPSLVETLGGEGGASGITIII